MDFYRDNYEKYITADLTSAAKLNLFPLDDIVHDLTGIINKTIHTAIELITSDVRGEFFYADPKLSPPTIEEQNQFLSFNAEYKEKYIHWINIQDFSINEIFAQVQDYINLWHLSDATKYTIVVSDKANFIPRKGTKYFLDAIFSKPTPSCPNPLAVAKVHFTVIVAELLPKHYPVNVIYRFEGYRSNYHAAGHREVRSKDFQRYFIDSILQRKLVFYTKIFECRNPSIKLNKTKQFEENEEEENEEGTKSFYDFDNYEIDEEKDAQKTVLLSNMHGLV